MSIFVRSVPVGCLIGHIIPLAAAGVAKATIEWLVKLRALAHPARAGMLVPSKWGAEAILLCASWVSDIATHHARDSGAPNSDGHPTSLCPDKKRQPHVTPEQPRPVHDWGDSRHKAHDGIRCRIPGQLLRLRPHPARKQRQRCRLLSFSCQPLLTSLWCRRNTDCAGPPFNGTTSRFRRYRS